MRYDFSGYYVYERRRIVYSPTQLIVNILVSQKRRSVNKVLIEDLQILVEDFTFSKSLKKASERLFTKTFLRKFNLRVNFSLE